MRIRWLRLLDGLLDQGEAIAPFGVVGDGAERHVTEQHLEGVAQLVADHAGEFADRVDAQRVPQQLLAPAQHVRRLQRVAALGLRGQQRDVQQAIGERARQRHAEHEAGEAEGEGDLAVGGAGRRRRAEPTGEQRCRCARDRERQAAQHA